MNFDSWSQNPRLCCFKIEKLSVSLTANNIANSNYWTFSCLFKLFTLKKTHTSHFFPILLNIFWEIIENMGQIGALFSHSHCLKRLHVLINLPLLTWTSRVNSNQNRFSKQQSSNALWIIFVFHHNYIFVRLLFHTERHSAFWDIPLFHFLRRVLGYSAIQLFRRSTVHGSSVLSFHWIGSPCNLAALLGICRSLKR